MTLDELRSINDDEIRELIDRHKNDDPSEFALRNSGRNIPVRAAAEQIYCYQRAHKKLPELSKKGFLYERTALEQASGELTAKYKSSLISGKKLIDVTGGLGIDTIFFSEKFQSVCYCEENPVLSELFRINSSSLRIQNIKIFNEDSIKVLQSFPDNYFTWLYADPSRRTKIQRLLNPQNYSPSVMEHQDLFMSKAENVLIKLSPANEIEEIKKSVRNIARISVVSVDNECREILLQLNRNSQEAVKEAVLLSSGKPARVFRADLEFQNKIIDDPRNYFYEPDAAIIKARVTSNVAAQFHVRFINKSVDYLTSEYYIDDFPGRKFLIKEYFIYNKKALKEYFKQNSIINANFARRDFPDSPEVLHKKYNIVDGGKDYFFFTKDKDHNLIVIHCLKPGQSPEEDR